MFLQLRQLALVAKVSVKWKSNTILSYLKVNTDLNVQVPPIPGVGVHLELAKDLLPLLARHVVTQVESSLKMRCFVYE